MTLSSLFRSDAPEGDDGEFRSGHASPSADNRADSAAAESLERSVAALKERQHEDGWWKGELETNVTMDAEDLLLREFLGIRTERQTAGGCPLDPLPPTRRRDVGDVLRRVLRTSRRPSRRTWRSSWPATPPDDPHMQLALEYIRGEGGIGASRVFTRIWLALFGKWPWESLPILPARAHAAAAVGSAEHLRLRVLGPPDGGSAHRRERPPTGTRALHRHRRARPRTGSRAPPLARARGPVASTSSTGRCTSTSSGRSDSFAAISLGKAERWIIKRQEADGSWGGIQPPWVYSLIALHLQGYPLDHPVMQAALEGLDAFTIEDEAGRRIEACQSPVWDTALAVVALGRCRRASGRPVAPQGRSLAGRRRDHGSGRLVRAAA